MDLIRLLTLYAASHSKKPTEHTVSGLATCFTANMQSNLNAYEIGIAPIQPGSNNPSPTNIRNILGADGGITICRAGKNIYDQTTYPLTQDRWVSGTAGTTGTITGCACTYDYIPCDNIAGQTITINKRPNGNNPGIAFYSGTSTDTFIDGVKNNGGTAGTPWTITVPYNAKYMRFTVASGETDIQIELGSVSTEYEPFVNITEYPIVFSNPSDVFYGGTLNVLTGDLTVTYGSYTFTGSQSDQFTLTNEATKGAYTFTRAMTPVLDRIFVKRSADYYMNIGVRSSVGTSADIVQCYNGAPTNQIIIYVRQPESDGTLESFCSYLNEHPLQMVFPLETPYTVHFDPITVQTLLGSNTIWNNKAMTNSVTYLNKE